MLSLNVSIFCKYVDIKCRKRWNTRKYKYRTCFASHAASFMREDWLISLFEKITTIKVADSQSGDNKSPSL